MKKTALKITTALLATFSAIPALADPKVFGMEIGVTTETQLKSLYRANITGTNKYSDGNMYSIPASAVNFDGIKDVTAIFDANGKLVAVLTTLPKSKFDYLNNILNGKYRRTRQEIPFVGNKKAIFRDGRTEITLDAPHMSFDMSMNYIRDEFMQKYRQVSEAEKRQSRSNDASRL